MVCSDTPKRPASAFVPVPLCFSAMMTARCFALSLAFAVVVVAFVFGVCYQYSFPANPSKRSKPISPSEQGLPKQIGPQFSLIKCIGCGAARHLP